MELLVVMLANALWLVVWERVGYMPRYGHPEAWSTPPLSDHPILTLFCGIQGLAFGWAGVQRSCSSTERIARTIVAAMSCGPSLRAWARYSRGGIRRERSIGTWIEM
jgi:hypothetical protein